MTDPTPTWRVGRQSPVNIWREGDPDTQVAMARTDWDAEQLVEAANLGAILRTALAHHLGAGTDPCQDRGVEWPCDVAAALGEDT